MKPSQSAGFTLIEMSIVLVIIGLIVGGILTGRDLIEAAVQRAQISQIEKYNTAVRTFQGKYGYLAGDMPASAASQFGFVARSGAAGRGDGNGVLEGTDYVSSDYGWNQDGENVFFWEDLSTAGLIDQSFNTATDALYITTVSSGFNRYVPTAKIGNGNDIFVYSLDGIGLAANDNYMQVVIPSAMSNQGNLTCSAGLSVMQAYNIDKKTDDGLPLTGRITTNYVSGSATYPPVVASTNAASDSATTCYNTTSNTYSIGINGGNGHNCALSFKFQ